MKRHKHNLSHYKLATADMGKLIPVCWYETLPGDTFQMASSALIRVSPLVAPVMHPVTVRFHHWFVPNRLLWTGWEDFITGGADGLGGSAGAYPTISINPALGSLSDHLGMPVTGASQVVCPFAHRAYALIFNEMYRDEDLVTKIGFSNASGVDATTNTVMQSIAWEKDYFTASRPWPQKGPNVTLPLGTSAPVTGNIDAQALEFRSAGSGGGTVRVPNVQNDGSKDVVIPAAADSETVHIWKPATPVGAGDLTADLSAATATNVNAVRRAFALQRYQEARAMYGHRYTEYLQYLGIRSSDARLQRPEYLGGGKQTIAFSEVLQTGPGTDAVGTMKGHGIAAMRTRRYRRFFEEHGIVMTLMSVRPRTMYQDGLHRSWNRRTKEDYWQKELERIGQQEILNKEIYAAHATPDGIFSYGDRYSEYRHLPSKVSGDFRTTLNFWHLGRIFGSAPALNASFVTCDPSKRVHAVQTSDVLWCMVSHKIVARRMVAPFNIGRVL